MGRGVGDLSDAQRRAYRLLDGRGMVEVETAAGVRSPVEISAEILKVLRLRAEQALGGELVGAVITVPAYFDDAQRQATKDAALRQRAGGRSAARERLRVYMLRSASSSAARSARPSVSAVPQLKVMGRTPSPRTRKSRRRDSISAMRRTATSVR